MPQPRLMLKHPTGPLFRNSSGREWTTDAVNCAFGAIHIRMGMREMERAGVSIADKEIVSLMPKLKATRVVHGSVVKKTPASLRAEAKRKLNCKLAAEHATRYSLYALRHSFATNALKKGIDSLTVAVLLGHKDPSTLARVYQHLNQNPKHLLSQVKRATA